MFVIFCYARPIPYPGAPWNQRGATGHGRPTTALTTAAPQTHLAKTKRLEMRAPNEALSFTGHEKFIIPRLYMKL